MLTFGPLNNDRVGGVRGGAANTIAQRWTIIEAA